MKLFELVAGVGLLCATGTFSYSALQASLRLTCFYSFRAMGIIRIHGGIHRNNIFIKQPPQRANIPHRPPPRSQFLRRDLPNRCSECLRMVRTSLGWTYAEQSAGSGVGNRCEYRTEGNCVVADCIVSTHGACHIAIEGHLC